MRVPPPSWQGHLLLWLKPWRFPGLLPVWWQSGPVGAFLEEGFEDDGVPLVRE